MLRFSLPANLEKCLCRLGHQVRNFKAVLASRLKELLGDLRSRNTVAFFRGHELLGTLQAGIESVADSKGESLSLGGLLWLLRFFGHLVLLLGFIRKMQPFQRKMHLDTMFANNIECCGQDVKWKITTGGTKEKRQ